MIGAVYIWDDTNFVPPVGMIVETDGETSPAADYAGTVWMQIKDVLIIAAGDVFVADSSGGSSTCSLTQENLPPHDHPGITSIEGLHTHTVTSMTKTYWQGDNSSYPSHDKYGSSGPSRTRTSSTSGAHTHTGTLAATGGGESFSILNPYYATNVWQRIS